MNFVEVTFKDGAKAFVNAAQISFIRQGEGETDVWMAGDADAFSVKESADYILAETRRAGASL